MNDGLLALHCTVLRNAVCCLLFNQRSFDASLLKIPIAALNGQRWTLARVVTLRDWVPVVMDTAFVDETISHPFVVQPCAQCVCLCVDLSKRGW